MTDKIDIALLEQRMMSMGRWRHKKRGTIYEVIGPAQVQSDRPLSNSDVVVVYRGEDGQLWVRPNSEFCDGRFEKIEKGAN